MIIGITGKNESEKGRIIDFFREKGFKYCSMQSFIERKSEETIRKEHHPQYIAEKVYENIQEDFKKCFKEKHLVENIKNPYEVMFFKQQNPFGFYLISTSQNEKSGTRNNTIIENHQNNIERCIEKADYKITGFGKEEINKELEEIYANIEGKFKG